MATKPIKQRVTITLSPEVIALYMAVSEKSGQSFSATINDWLESTGPALEQLTQQVLDVKSRPAQVLNDLMLFQEQMQSNLDDVKDQIKHLVGSEATLPPLTSNTRGKLPGTPKQGGF